MLDPEIAGLLQMLESLGAPAMSTGTPEAARTAFRTLTVDMRPAEALAQVGSIEDSQVPGGVPIRVYRPEGDGPVPTIAFLHGGGFVIGDLDTHDDHARLLCRDVDAVVVSVDYRLAPEHPFPVPLDDCIQAVRWVLDNVATLGGDASRVAVGGDSAGGNLSAAVSLALRGTEPGLAAQLLLYPAVDFDAGGDYPSREENATGMFLTSDDMAWFGAQYLGDGDGTDARASVIEAPDLSGLPPAIVAVAGNDPLRDEGLAYASALEKAGVQVQVRRYDGMIHGFFGLGHVSAGAREANAELCADLKTLLG